jgi:hypothetical protein
VGIYKLGFRLLLKAKKSPKTQKIKFHQMQRLKSIFEEKKFWPKIHTFDL